MKTLITILMISGFSLALQAQSGELDTSFNGNGIVVDTFSTNENSANTVAIQADGKIIVAGNTGTSAKIDMSVARYNTDGSADTSFGDNGKIVFSTPFIKSFVNDIKIQNDGKIVLGGYQWNNSTGDFILARLNPNGSFDLGFGTDGIAILDNGMGEIGKSIYLLDDGKILISGDSDDQFTMAKTNSDGSLDTSFGTNGWVRTLFPVWSYSNDIDVNQAGEILLTGMTIDSDSNWKFALAKFNADGDLDSSFGDMGTLIVSVGNDYDFGIRGSLLDDGKILVGGHSYFGTQPLRYEIAVVRLNADGSFDNSYGTNGISKFRWNDDAENYLNDMTFQNDGKLILAGRYSDSIGDYYAMARLETDGTLDPTFGTDGKVSGNVGLTADTATAVTIQTDGKIVIAGNTYDFTNPTQFFIARFLNENLSVQDLDAALVKLYPNPAQNFVQIDWNKGSQKARFELFHPTGQKLKDLKIENNQKINVSDLTPGLYLIRLTLDSKTQTFKLIKK